MNAAGRQCEIDGAPGADSGAPHVRPALVNFDLKAALYQSERQQRPLSPAPIS